MRSLLLSIAVAFAVTAVTGCGDDSANVSDAGSDAAPDSAPPPPCTDSFTFDAGDPTGHADPFGVAAGEARAGRLTEGAWPADPTGLGFVRADDFVLANEHIAVVIEDVGPSDLLDPWGGRPIGAAVMEGGVPTRPADFGEMVVLLGRFTMATENVSVIADGADGGAAIVRATGPLEVLPFLAPLATVLLSAEFGDLVVAIDWVLEPGAEQVELRLSLASTRTYDTPVIIPLFAFFQGPRMPEWHPGGAGFATGIDPVDYIAYDDDDATSYALSSPNGAIAPTLALANASLFQPESFTVGACSETALSYAHMHVGGPAIDGLRAAIARTEGTPLREVTGTVSFGDGSPAAGAYVNAAAPGGGHVTRALTDAAGAFTLHLPAEDVALTPWLRGHAIATAVTVAADAGTVALVLPEAGWIHVVATDAATGAGLPVRVQVVPEGELPTPPENFGVTPIVEGRLHVAFPTDGEVTLVAPPGRHLVYVSRGFEWELVSTTIDVAAGATTEVPILMEHVVDTPGVLCGDFHVHTQRSFDTSDPVLYKMRGLAGDGLEIAVRSDHEWVGDFEPTIRALGLEDWAYGVSSLELTTFDFGHFGIFPLEADPTLRNDGAIEWPGRTPQQAFDDAHGRSGTHGSPIVIVNHGRTFGGLMGEGAYFDRVGYDPLTGMVGVPELWSESFDAIEVFNESDFDANVGGTVDDWFSFLNAGRHIFATGASDSHQIADQPPGYPRTCLDVGLDDATALRAGGGAALIRDTLLAGHAVIDGGAFIDVVGPGGEGPGDTVTSAGGTSTMHVTVRAPSFVDLDRLRVFVDGEVTETIVLDESTRDAMDPTIRFSEDISVAVAAGALGSWALVVADGRDSTLSPVYPDHRPFGVTNPVFFVP